MEIWLQQNAVDLIGHALTFESVKDDIRARDRGNAG